MTGRAERTGDGLLLEVLDLLKVSDEQARQLERNTKRLEEHSDAVQDLLARAIYKVDYLLNGSRSRGGCACRRLEGAECEPRLKRFARANCSELAAARQIARITPASEMAASGLTPAMWAADFRERALL